MQCKLTRIFLEKEGEKSKFWIDLYLTQKDLGGDRLSTLKVMLKESNVTLYETENGTFLRGTFDICGQSFAGFTRCQVFNWETLDDDNNSYYFSESSMVSDGESSDDDTISLSRLCEGQPRQAMWDQKERSSGREIQVP